MMLPPPTPSAHYQLDNYDAWMRSWGAADDTRRARLGFARRLATRWPDPTAITSTDLEAMLAEHDAAWTKSTYFAHMRGVLAWLVEAGVLDADPTASIRRPAYGKANPRPLTPAQVSAALTTATRTTRHALLLGTLAGLRASETASMHSSQITETKLYVVGKGEKPAVLPTHPALWSIAVELGDGWWFPRPDGGGPVRGHAISERVTRLFGRLGIEGSFHRCRHYYGTSLLRAGVNIRVVQELMRHASLATTAAYLGVDDDEKRAAVMALAA